MHQKVEQYVTLDDRPDRDNIIEKDEVLSLIIDVEILSSDEFYGKYFGTRE